MMSRNTLARCLVSGPIRVTATNKFNHTMLNSHVWFGEEDKKLCVPLRYRINCVTARLLSVVGLRT